MKKLLALLTAIAVLLSVTACGGVSGPAEPTRIAKEPANPATEASTEAPTEVPAGTSAEQEAFLGIAEELLRSENTVTVSYSTPGEYEETLHKLGYTEFKLNYYAENKELACQPVSLTYNDNAFRLDFSYYDYPVVDGQTDFSQLILAEGWVLYGTKAESRQNISNVNYDDYLDTDEFDWVQMWTTDAVRGLDYCPQVFMTYCCNYDEAGEITRWTYHASNFYPLTGNVYNFVHDTDSHAAARYDSPVVLISWHEGLMEAWQSMELPQFWFVPGRIADGKNIEQAGNQHLFLSNTRYCFEKGMTLQQWADSIYNWDGWHFEETENGGVLFSPENNYVVVIGHDDQGRMCPIDDYLWSGSYEIPVLSYEAYCEFIGE